MYIAQRFEHKCIALVRYGELANLIRTVPETGLEDLIAQTPADQLLGRALSRLEQLLPEADARQFATLAAARKARNYIAHEAALFGIHSESKASLTERMLRLGREIRTLADGDNIVSSWLYQVEEPHESVSRDLMADYPTMIADWTLEPVYRFMREEWT